MKVLNSDVFAFINVVGAAQNTKIRGESAFAISMAKQSLIHVYSALEDARKSMLDGVYSADDDKGKESAMEVANREWVELMGKEVEVPHVTKVSITALLELDMSIADVDLLRNMPFVDVE